MSALHTSPSIAVLGLGAMGSRIAERALSNGASVIVWNRTPAAADALNTLGATLAATPREAAAAADVVLVCVTDDVASRDVWLSARTGVVHALTPQSLAIDVSTLTPSWIVKLAAALQSTGATFVEAPMVGSRPQVDAGQLVFLAGGATEAVRRASAVLMPLGAAVHHVGDVGMAARLKLAVNALFAAQVATYAELTGWLRREGVAPEAIDVVRTLPVFSPALTGVATQIAAGAYPPLFPVSLVEKDLRYLVQSADARQSAVPLSTATRAQFAAAVTLGVGNENISAVAKLYT
jgi:3-hydroxyisobutyrate dehydrogenase